MQTVKLAATAKEASLDAVAACVNKTMIQLSKENNQKFLSIKTFSRLISLTFFVAVIINVSLNWAASMLV